MRGLVVVLMGIAPFAVIGTAGAGFLAGNRSDPAHSSWFYVGRLSSLPRDGTPLRLPVQVPQRDAWTRLPDRVLGHVFLRQLPDGRVLAIRAEHHRFRIPVVCDPQVRIFRSACWLVEWDLDGRELRDGGRTGIGEDLELLPVRISGDEVFVRYRALGDD